MKPIHLIAAIDSKRGLGKDNDLAWRLPPDMKHFKEKTTITQDPDKQNAVIMGRKTWESIPEKFRPLTDRINVVLSKTLSEAPTGTQVFTSLEDALQDLNQNPSIETIFIIGGSNLYNQSLNQEIPDKIILTQIHQDFNCDVFLDPLPSQYSLTSETDLTSHKEITFQFQEYTKN